MGSIFYKEDKEDIVIKHTVAKKKRKKLCDHFVTGKTDIDRKKVRDGKRDGTRERATPPKKRGAYTAYSSSSAFATNLLFSIQRKMVTTKLLRTII